jgi:hypothetical protein
VRALPLDRLAQRDTQEGLTVVDFKAFVVHCMKSKYDVLISRPGPWGNPYSFQKHSMGDYKVATRAEAIASYEAWLRARPVMVARAKRELKGKVLGCYCSPLPCHGEVLVKVANEPDDF